MKRINFQTSSAIIITLFAMLFGVIVSTAQAVTPPNILTYQGRLLDANGAPVSSSSLSMKFFLYTAATSGTCVWSNSSSTCHSNTPASTTSRTVTLTSGLFTENLGDTAASTPYAAISDSTFADNTSIYLAVEIAGETLSPRKQLVAAPYALNAETLDGIDLSVIQLWEVGTNGSYEDDAAAIVGADAAFSYGSGGAGDLRVADQLEVMGDGYLDNNLVVGASTSATETISNASFSLGGDDLFVASDIGVEGVIYNDGGINTAGTLTAVDVVCTDCLDFAEFVDAMSLDANSSIAQDGTETFTITNSGTGNTIVNLASTGDFIVQDNGIAAFTLDDTGNTTIGGTLGVTGNTTLTGDLAVNGDDITSDGALTINPTTYTRIGDVSTPADASTDDDLYVSGAFEADGVAYFDGIVDIDLGGASTTTTSGILEMDITAGNAAVDAFNIVLTQSNGAAAATEATAMDILLDAEDADGNLIGINITNQAGTSPAVAGNYEALLRLTNTEGLANLVTDAIFINDTGNVAGSIVDAIDVSDTEITNAINVGANTILGTDAVIDFTGFDVAATTGAITIAGSADGTDALTLSAGDIYITNGDLDVAGGDFNVTLDAADTAGITNSADTTTTGVLAISQTTGSTNVGNTVAMSLATTLTNYADDNAADTRVGFDFTLTNNATDAGLNDSISGIRINDLGGTNNTNGRESALEIGASWDFNIYLNDASSLFAIQDAGTLTWTDVPSGAANTLMTLTDAGTTGTLSVTGAISANIGNSGSYTAALCWDNAGTSEIQDCVGSVVADYAEQYPVAAGVNYGDIVVPGMKVTMTTDGQKIVQLIKSSKPYEGPVSGIVSNNYGDFTSAGYNIPESEHPMPIALVGRVPVNVTNENGSIRVGDYLTTSSTPGFAMKATEVGRVIGMALNDFDGSSGQVMVQVNNGWYVGDVIAGDGMSTVLTDKVVIAPLTKATASTPSVSSFGFALRGSVWNGSEAQAVEMMLQNVVTSATDYRLSVRSTNDTEVAYVTDKGTMQLAGDLLLGGNFYPSDRGVVQTSKYIYYDGSEGTAGDFMRTNAKGWSTGSYDFAEMFPSHEALTSGDLVAFSGTGESVIRASKEHKQMIVGVVSTRPGFLAGENVTGSYPIALAGRVPTRVTNENGDIHVGDPLAVSSTPGFAMKANRSGVIVGYALETFLGAQGSILAYVSPGHWNGEETSATPGTNNVASSFGQSSAIDFSVLNMNGNIYLAGHDIVSVGRITGISDVWQIEMDGTIKTTSTLKTLITSHAGEKVETTAVTSPEAMITLSGTAKLLNGQVEVRFEDVVPEYNDVISAEAPIRVVVTPSGPVSLYVVEKDHNHFVVQRFAGETADVEFDWMVNAYRKGFEPKEEVDSGEVGEQKEERSAIIASPSVSEGEALSIPTVNDTAPIQPEQTTEISEPVVTEEPATPVSPDSTLVDSASEAEGGTLSAEEPAQVSLETTSSPQADAP